MVGGTTVSPPTRGWTSPSRFRYRSGAGFPAHAGMDLPSVDHPLPGPPAQVSPPTRGWTHGRHLVDAHLLGFPAHAGMDPVAMDQRRANAGFPRPRGDGPLPGADLVSGDVVSPPTRGWTVRRVLDRSVRAGFPAHAGMDLLSFAVASLLAGFPRPRGDGPQGFSTSRQQSAVSPPTRGWTPRSSHIPWTRGGFPAHAGMDPPCAEPAPRRT